MARVRAGGCSGGLRRRLRRMSLGAAPGETRLRPGLRCRGRRRRRLHRSEQSVEPVLTLADDDGLRNPFRQPTGSACGARRMGAVDEMTVRAGIVHVRRRRGVDGLRQSGLRQSGGRRRVASRKRRPHRAGGAGEVSGPGRTVPEAQTRTQWVVVPARGGIHGRLTSHRVYALRASCVMVVRFSERVSTRDTTVHRPPATSSSKSRNVKMRVRLVGNVPPIPDPRSQETRGENRFPCLLECGRHSGAWDGSNVST